MQHLTDAIQKCNGTVLSFGRIECALLWIESFEKTYSENRRGKTMLSYPMDETLPLFVTERVAQKNEVEIGR